MTKKRVLSSFLFALALAAAVYALPALAAETNGGEGDSEQNLIAAAQAMRASGRVQFNFKDLDVIQFIRFMSELLGENIVVNPGVKGAVSVVSPKTVSISEARQVMLSILEMNGLSLQGMGGYSKVMPISSGPSTGNEVVKGPQSVTPSEQIVIQIVPLDYVKAGYVIEPVRLGTPGVNLAPLATGSGVLLTGKAVLLNRAASIIRALDVPDGVRAIKTIPLQYTSAKLVEGHLNAIGKDVASKLSGLFAIGDERSSQVILVGSRQSIREAERILAELDIPATVGNFHVYKLQNADAKTVSEQLSQVLSVAARLQPDQQGTFPSTVVPDLPTNSIILTATQEQYSAIRGIIEELDTQPKQVLLRGLIAEVNLSKLNNAGIDWSAWGGSAADNLLMGGNAQLGSQGVPAEFLQWFREMTKTEDTYYDQHGNLVTTNNTQGMGLVYAYIKMLNTFNAINILSMPRLMCTDNLPSVLQVGQVIPQLRGSTSDISNPAAVQNSYEYKDTGLILKVTPHIRSGNLVALDIEQTIEELVSTTGQQTPTTSKRLIQTNVQVGNDDTIILGGLIREVERTLKNRVPGLSYIPLIGNLFTSSTREREKVDLMVFLTPSIIETPRQAAEATFSVTTGEPALSEGELKTIMKNYEEFQKSNKQEGVSQGSMRPSSVDIFPPQASEREIVDVEQPDGQKSQDQ
ncbi:MAG: type II secretion system secretin GspD [Synergistaceae bacterium]|jgi:general secretion pathway protein D|nr:type II secretion system secretin GspD [Synergistaceae bacterium]